MSADSRLNAEPHNKGMKLTTPGELGGSRSAWSGVVESGFAAYAQCYPDPMPSSPEYGMIDQPKATLVAREAFELADSGQLEAAVERYREALSLAHPDYYCLPDYHGEFASVLARLGRNEEALLHYSRALELEQRQAREPTGPGVLMARYFLAQHLVSMNRPTEALSTLQPSLGQAGKLETPLRTAEAEAANRAGDTKRARHAAALALPARTSDSQRTYIRERLRELLNDEAG